MPSSLLALLATRAFDYRRARQAPRQRRRPVSGRRWR
jgi:hypothetical protein